MARRLRTKHFRTKRKREPPPPRLIRRELLIRQFRDLLGLGRLHPIGEVIDMGGVRNVRQVWTPEMQLREFEALALIYRVRA
jgi:hypothetical protein